MEEDEPTVAGSQHGQRQTDEDHGQAPSHKPAGKNPQEQIYDDRVFTFNNGISR